MVPSPIETSYAPSWRLNSLAQVHDTMTQPGFKPGPNDPTSNVSTLEIPDVLLNSI